MQIRISLQAAAHLVKRGWTPLASIPTRGKSGRDESVLLPSKFQQKKNESHEILLSARTCASFWELALKLAWIS